MSSVTIIFGGRRIGYQAVRAEVKAEYADKLARSSLRRQLLIRRVIDREVNRRCERQFPARGLYSWFAAP